MKQKIIIGWRLQAYRDLGMHTVSKMRYTLLWAASERGTAYAYVDDLSGFIIYRGSY